MTPRDRLDAAIFAIYTEITEGTPKGWDEFEGYEPEDIGIVLRAGDAAIVRLYDETGLDAIRALLSKP